MATKQIGEFDLQRCEEIGATLAAISAARAASTETLVRMLHRDWDDPEVQDEVARINEEQGLGNVPDPVEGFGA